MAGLVPATHVFEGGYVDRREGVDDRDEPGQGDLEWLPGRCKQPNSCDDDAGQPWLRPVTRLEFPLSLQRCRVRAQ